jgi:endonuclease/exonuclease/phosphatase family metal-dependent hydrolase
MRIATFNVQNLRLRHQDGEAALDGAVDRDMPGLVPSAALDAADRRRTAEIIRAADADVVALQEVFDTEALDFFHDRFLLPTGAAPYAHRICLPGNDGRGLNVAALSRIAPARIESHARLTGRDLGFEGLPDELRDAPLFRRDCLRLDLAGVALFICHLKAPYPDAEKARAVRRAEAWGVRAIVERAFPRPEDACWIVLGDFNEPVRATAGDPAIAPLKEGFAVDLMDRLPVGRDWTFEAPDTHIHSRPDRILLSPRLAARYPHVTPQILRSGMSPATRPHASDHALVFADFPGLETG